MTGNTWASYAITGGTSWNSSWWPTSGYRYGSSAVLQIIGNSGWYWSSSMYPSTAYRAYDLYFNFNNTVDTSNNGNRSYGLAIRCIEEIDEKQSIKKTKNCHCGLDPQSHKCP